MGAMDKINQMKDKAKEAMSSGKGDDMVEKAGDMVDEKTGGKYADKVDKAQQMAKDQMKDKQRQGNQQQGGQEQ